MRREKEQDQTSSLGHVQFSHVAAHLVQHSTEQVVGMIFLFSHQASSCLLQISSTQTKIQELLPCPAALGQCAAACLAARAPPLLVPLPARSSSSLALRQVQTEGTAHSAAGRRMMPGLPCACCWPLRAQLVLQAALGSAQGEGQAP